jgi:hypothetical protein
MLERVDGFSFSRPVVVSLLGALVGCGSAETSIYGSVEVVPSAVRGTACERPAAGHLRLDGMRVADVLTISAHELCHSWVVRKELPAGLYTVSWQPDGDADSARWAVREAGIVNVFPEQTTTLRMLALDPHPELLSQASPDDAEPRQW